MALTWHTSAKVEIHKDYLRMDTPKAFDDFKAYEVMFFDMQKYVYSESVFNTSYIEIKHKC